MISVIRTHSPVRLTRAYHVESRVSFIPFSIDIARNAVVSFIFRSIDIRRPPRHSPCYRMLPVTIYTYLFFIEAVQAVTGTRCNRYLAICSAKCQLLVSIFNHIRIMA